MRGPDKQTWSLILTACVVNLMVFSATVAFSWTSPCIPRLTGLKEPENNPLDHHIDETEQSLLTALFIVGATIGPFLGIPVVGRIGRKLSIIIFTIPVIVCMSIKAFATEIWLFYMARVIGGLSAGIMYTIVPIFIAEISESHNRGALSALTGMLTVIGNLYAYSVGSYVSIKWFSLSGLVAPIVMIVVLFFFIPETPYYYLSRDDEESARKVLKRYRNKNSDEIDEEINMIRKTLGSKQAMPKLGELLRSRACINSLRITIIIIVIQQLTGAYPIQLNLQLIFSESGSSLSDEISSIIVGVVKVISYIFTLVAIDRFGRRFLLLTSGAGLFLSLAVLGTYFFLKSEGIDLEAISWLPVVCLVIFVVVFNSGISIVPIILLGEMFPQDIKSLASIIVITFSSIVSFLVTFVFPYMQTGIGLGITFWLFSIAGIMCIIYTFFWIPETKGKSLLEIQEILGRRKMKGSNNNVI